MWAQQWRYIARAMESGYRVLRSDTDVYLAEDPYPIMRGPLFSHFEMVVQHDFFGARERPRCDTQAPTQAIDSAGRIPSCGRRSPHLALLNIGLVYLRSSPGGGVYAVINGTWCVSQVAPLHTIHSQGQTCGSQHHHHGQPSQGTLSREAQRTAFKASAPPW